MEKAVEHQIFDKKKLLETVKDIKGKFETLKKENLLITEGQTRLFKPIVEPLKSIDENLQQRKQQQIATATTTSPKMEKKTVKEDKEIVSNGDLSELTGENVSQITQNLSYTYPIAKDPGINWGISVMGKTEGGNPNYVMTLSKCPIKFTKDLIVAKGKIFPRTRSLYSLLTSKKKVAQLSQEEEEDYVTFLKHTGDFYLNPKTSSDASRFKDIIKKFRDQEAPDTLYTTLNTSNDANRSIMKKEDDDDDEPKSFESFEQSLQKKKEVVEEKRNKSAASSASSTPKKRKGKGLPPLENFAKVSKINPKLEFVWYDNLNEIVERYKLLVAAQEAGNTNVVNELLAIEEELNEFGIQRRKKK